MESHRAAGQFDDDLSIFIPECNEITIKEFIRKDGQSVDCLIFSQTLTNTNHLSASIEHDQLLFLTSTCSTITSCIEMERIYYPRLGIQVSFPRANVKYTLPFNHSSIHWYSIRIDL